MEPHNRHFDPTALRTAVARLVLREPGWETLQNASRPGAR